MVDVEDTVEVMADIVEREKLKPNQKQMPNPKPMLSLKPMLMPMPTTDMVVVMVDMEVMAADMVDTDTDVNADLLMLTMDMVVMVDTVMAVNLTSSQFIKPKSNYTTSFQHTKEYIQ